MQQALAQCAMQHQLRSASASSSACSERLPLACLRPAAREQRPCRGQLAAAADVRLNLAAARPSGHRGKFGHEFLEFEFRPDGEVRGAARHNGQHDLAQH